MFSKPGILSSLSVTGSVRKNIESKMLSMIAVTIINSVGFLYLIIFRILDFTEFSPNARGHAVINFLSEEALIRVFE